MSINRKFVFLTSAGNRPSIWLWLWVIVGVAVAGVILLSLGLFLALAAVVATFLALVPAGIRRWFAAPARPEGPSTIEGEYSIAPPDRAGAGEAAQPGRSTGDSRRPEAPATIEGEYSIAPPDPADAGDAAQLGRSPGDERRPERRS